MINIPDGKYSGFIWMSDKDEPEVFIDRSDLNISGYTPKTNPFILEAYLYDDNAKKSISIQKISVRFFQPDMDEILSISPISASLRSPVMQKVFTILYLNPEPLLISEDKTQKLLSSMLKAGLNNLL